MNKTMTARLNKLDGSTLDVELTVREDKHGVTELVSVHQNVPSDLMHEVCYLCVEVLSINDTYSLDDVYVLADGVVVKSVTLIK